MGWPLCVLVVLLAGCHSQPATSSGSMPHSSTEFAVSRSVSDPERVELRARVEDFERSGGAVDSQRLTALGSDGCPEAWILLLRSPFLPSFEPQQVQRQCLERLADAGLDDPWFAPRVADLWRWLLTRENRPSLSSIVRDRLVGTESAIARIAETAPDRATRAAAAGVLGRMLINGYLEHPDGAAPVARGAEHLRNALSTWDDGVEVPIALGLRATTSDGVRAELESLLRAATARGPGATLPTVPLLTASGIAVTSRSAALRRPALYIVWGFD